MRIVAISDTHFLHKQIVVPDGDVLIHAGDFSNHGTQLELIEFNAWLGTLPHKHKLVTPGNHDLFSESDPGLAKALFTNATYLIDEEVTIDDRRIYMSPWTPQFFDWAFMKPRDQMYKVWAGVPDNIDILVTHGPAHGILDLTRTEHAGCAALKQCIDYITPSYHIFGHIHEGYGQIKIGRTTHVNAAICTARYKPTNKPIVIEV